MNWCSSKLEKALKLQSIKRVLYKHEIEKFLYERLLAFNKQVIEGSKVDVWMRGFFYQSWERMDVVSIKKMKSFKDLMLKKNMKKEIFWYCQWCSVIDQTFWNFVNDCFIYAENFEKRLHIHIWTWSIVLLLECNFFWHWN